MEYTLVTGASGFLGQALIQALRAEGRPVRAILRRNGDAARRAAVAALGAEIWTADLTDVQALRGALADVTAVFHLAGRLYAPGTPDAVYTATHVAGTEALLAACAAAPNLRTIVHCSTTGVLGPTGAHPADETAPLRPSNIYERTKAEAEQIALDAAANGLPLTVVRPALVYGPGDLHLLGWFRAIQRGYYRVVGSGASLLHPIYIDDLVDGMLRAAATPAAVGRVYHLVGHAALPISELAAAIATALGRRLPRLHIPLSLAVLGATVLEAIPGVPVARLPLTRSRIAFMTQSRVYKGERARRELGFAPQTGLAAGLRSTVAWYRRRGLV